MSTFSWKSYRDHALLGQLFSMARKGDGIALHARPVSERQSLIVRRGRIMVYGPTGPQGDWCEVGQPGDIISLSDEMHPHEIVATEDGTEVLGLYVYGRPVNLSQDVPMQGVVNRPLKYPLSAS